MKLSEKVNILRPNTTSREFFANSGGVKCVHYGDVYKNYSGKVIKSSTIINNFSLPVASSKILTCDAIIVPDVTETIEDWGHFVYIHYDGIPYTNGTHTFALVSENSLELQYLFFYLQSKNNRYRLQAFLNGSTVFQISLSNFYSFELDNYENNINEQRHIVDLIGTLDDKIECNEKITEKFNEYLQAIYKIFVARAIDFEILAKHIKKSGKKVNNGEWKNSQVVDLSTMPRNNVVINAFSSGENFSTNILTLEENALLYGSIRPYFRKCGFTTDIDFVAGTIHSFKPINENLFFWILATISSEKFHQLTNTKSQGTKMPIITFESFCDYQLPLISQNYLNEFNSLITPLFEKVKVHMLENRKLKKLKKLYLQKFFD